MQIYNKEMLAGCSLSPKTLSLQVKTFLGEFVFYILNEEEPTVGIH